MRLVADATFARRVEFVGGPGGGKSALSAHLVSELLARGSVPGLRATVLNDLQPGWMVNLRKLADAARFVRQQPATARRVAGVVSTSGQIDRRHAITKTVNLLAELTRGAAPGPSVSEQGVLQAVGSIQAGASRVVTADLLDLCHDQLPETVVRVVVDRDEQIRRLRQRQNGRSRLDGSDPMAERLDRIESQLDELLLDWRSTGSDRDLLVVHNRRGVPPGTVLQSVLTTQNLFLGRSTA